MSTAVPVWFDALHVGDVTVADDGALGFAYTEAWRATRGAFPVSLTLPLTDRLYASDVISPWRANLLPLNAEPRLAPLYDVSTVLSWPGVVQYFAQNIAGRKRKPGDVTAAHWDILARNMGYRPADVRKRVADLVDAMIAARVPVTDMVAGLPGSAPGYVEDAAEKIEANALRIAGRLRRAR